MYIYIFTCIEVIISHDFLSVAWWVYLSNGTVLATLYWLLYTLVLCLLLHAYAQSLGDPPSKLVGWWANLGVRGNSLVGAGTSGSIWSSPRMQLSWALTLIKGLHKMVRFPVSANITRGQSWSLVACLSVVVLAAAQYALEWYCQVEFAQERYWGLAHALEWYWRLLYSLERYW